MPVNTRSSARLDNGTGKTSMLARQVQKLVGGNQWNGDPNRSPVIVVSLTRAAAREVASRNLPIPDGAVSTLHSQGWRQQERPVLVTAEMVHDKWNVDHRQWRLTLNQFAKSDVANDDLDAKKPKTRGDGLMSRLELSRHGMFKSADDSVVAFGEAWTKFKSQVNAVDFTDMVEGAHESPPMDARFIIVDEAQDMSPLEVSVIKQWASDGVMFTTGDPRQALYVWRGADPMWLVAKDDSHRMVLSKSWRLPRKVRAVSESWVRQMGEWTQYDCSPREEDGVVARFPSNFIYPRAAVQKADEVAKAGGTAMLATTCGYHLYSIISTLRSMAIPYCNPWRVKNGAWNPLSYKHGTTMSKRLVALQAPPQTGRLWSAEEVYHWTDPLEANGLMSHGAKKAIQIKAAEIGSRAVTFGDMAGWFLPDAMNVLWSLAMENRNSNDLIDWWMSKMLPKKRKTAKYPAKVYKARGLNGVNEKPRIYVGTVHSFKGSEADSVWLFPDLSPAAHRGWSYKRGEGYDAVIRTMYVGMTRAKKELYLCDPQGVAVQWQNLKNL